MFKRFSMNMAEDVYIAIKDLAAEKGISMANVINSILRGYLRSRKARENDK